MHNPAREMDIPHGKSKPQGLLFSSDSGLFRPSAAAAQPPFFLYKSIFTCVEQEETKS